MLWYNMILHLFGQITMIEHSSDFELQEAPQILPSWVVYCEYIGENLLYCNKAWLYYFRTL